MGFRQLVENLGELADLPSRIVSEVADGINVEVAEQFASGTDPYGRAWTPLLPQTVRRKRGDTRTLRRTDALAAETFARPLPGAGVELTSLEYGRFHQSGTRHMVARMVLPSGPELPDAWQEIIADASARAFKKTMGR